MATPAATPVATHPASHPRLPDALAAVQPTPAIKDSLLHLLKRAETPQDSILLLYHLNDLTHSRPEKRVYLEQIIHTAHQANEVSVELDAIRNFCNIAGKNDSIMSLCEQWALSIPPSNDRSETLAFIRIDRISLKARSLSEKAKAKNLQELIANYDNEKSQDIYHQIVRLYEVSLFLIHSTMMDLSSDYLEKMATLIQALPADGRKILPNVYYTQLAIIYTQSQKYEKAIQADKQLLAAIRELEEDYLAKGRIYRNYQVNYYNCYRRMLYNFPALTEEEIENYYQIILQLVKRNQTVKQDYDTYHIPEIYYLMAKKEYRKALPLLQEVLQIDNAYSYYYIRLLQLTIEAAKAMNDQTTLLKATTQYNRMLEEYNTEKLAAKYKELQVLYDVNELKASNAELKLAKQHAELEGVKRSNRITLIALIVLSLLLACLAWLNLRSHKLAQRLKLSRQKLLEEQRTLLLTQQALTVARDQAESSNRMKTLFIQNMSHEIRTPLNAIVGFSQIIAETVQENGQVPNPEIENYTQTITKNSELLLTLVGDLLDISKMDAGEIKVKIQPCAVDALCRLVVQSVEHRVEPGVRLYCRPDEAVPASFQLKTDSTRLEQVLINLLTNACKFTTHGEIVLSYAFDEPGTHLVFSVTDTGMGIPKEKAEVIFERFEKLDPFAQGTGLGLAICRQIAQMLKAEIKLDTSYTGGARFLFIHPIE